MQVTLEEEEEEGGTYHYSKMNFECSRWHSWKAFYICDYTHTEKILSCLEMRLWVRSFFFGKKGGGCEIDRSMEIERERESIKDSIEW